MLQYPGPHRLPWDEWRVIRLEVLRRHACRCAQCGNKVDEKSAHIHHVLLRSEGGTDLPENLEPLCKGCHDLEHPHMKYTL